MTGNGRKNEKKSLQIGNVDSYGPSCRVAETRRDCPVRIPSYIGRKFRKRPCCIPLSVRLRSNGLVWDETQTCTRGIGRTPDCCRYFGVPPCPRAPVPPTAIPSRVVNFTLAYESAAQAGPYLAIGTTSMNCCRLPSPIRGHQRTGSGLIIERSSIFNMTALHHAGPQFKPLSPNP